MWCTSLPLLIELRLWHWDLSIYTRLVWIDLLPFPSGGVIKLHLQAWDSKKTETVTALRNSLYLDDYLIGGQAEELKNSDIDIFSDAKFVLHTWTSNVSESEEKNNDLSIAKQQLGSRQSESKVLRLPRDKDTDPKLSEERDRNDQGRSAEEPDQSVWLPGPSHTTHLARKLDLPGNL